jgi:hypothetical protein
MRRILCVGGDGAAAEGKVGARYLVIEEYLADTSPVLKRYLRAKADQVHDIMLEESFLRAFHQSYVLSSRFRTASIRTTLPSSSTV